MDKSEKLEAGNVFGLPRVPPLTVGIAIKGNSNSKYVVSWALDKFIPEENVVFKLLYVRTNLTNFPTSTDMKEMDWKTSQMLLPFKNMCVRRKVQVDVIMIQSDDVAKALAEEVAKCTIEQLVIGASSRSIFTRKCKENNMSSLIMDCIPNFCTVYAVSKGKLSSSRPSDLETNESITDDSSTTSYTNCSSNHTLSSQTDAASQLYYPSLLMQRFQALSTINQSLLHARTNSIETNHSRCQSLDTEVQALSTINQGLHHTRTDSSESDRSSCQFSNIEEGNFATVSTPSSGCKSLPADYQSWESYQSSTSDAFTDYSLSESQANINFELEKLRVEIRHARGIYAVAQSEAIDASRKLNNMNQRHLSDAAKLKEIKQREEEAKQLAREEKKRSDAAIREAKYVRECVEREISEKQEAELKAIRDAREKEKLENALAGHVQQYQTVSWEEIVSATSSFSENLKIGAGAYGRVYRCSLHHTTAAVKVLHAKEKSNSKQFRQELEILSRIRHPHLLILLGACPDHGCLVYEYMENGSLEDRILRVNNTLAIPWYDRYRIAWEVASVLVFLHNSKPNPIIHRDLKPANILLDRNLVSKVGDVGLSTMLDSDAFSGATMYKDTSPVGTLCYIDPEYQRSGLVSPKSDVYAFGIVILQLLTAKPAIALAHMVEAAMDDDRLSEILDPEAGKWPLEETKELAVLGLNCIELRCRDRPDLKDRVLPTLKRLKEVADKARDTIFRVRQTPPNHFICPILKDVMSDPCVAADGYTYDRKAIEKWLEVNDKSPMTNLALPNKNLLPNYTLLSAIMEWRSSHQ